ncbi:hypothetical protein G6F56_012551 [Rhizopus delemar]|nr:hypothetical protein G6F56_012551 [Rhizopus delemar]
MSQDTSKKFGSCGSTNGVNKSFFLDEYKEAIVVSSDEEWDELLNREGKGVLGHGRQRHDLGNEQREYYKIDNEKRKTSKDRSRSTEEKDNRKRKLTDKQIATIAECDDFDLDAVVEKLLQPSKRRAMEIEPSPPLDMECPICTRLYPRDKVERHASDCTGEYSDTEDDPTSRKNTIASSVARHQAKQRSNTSFVENVNYYAESEDLLASDGTGLNEEITGLTWESRGQTRFA